MLRRISLLISMVGIVAATLAASAAERFDSAYTKLKLDDCMMTSVPSQEGTDGGSWLCEGYRKIPVSVSEGDLRMFVSFGDNAANEMAASQTLSGFNSVNETLEWRLVESGGRQPFATILRWFVQTGEGGTDQVLIVTRLGLGATCQVARINATRTPDANTMAREIADTRARAFQCGVDDLIRVNMTE
ncbi:hypothetical protein [Breoghania sp.]|uniref:hypothetical protein n=1 Tax=Breoghania sp. TaxID=2065378 RepID=UPI002AAB32E7|nr:hypothetical protein [Breoghania sp.]